MGHRASAEGRFTDSAVFAHRIRECLNLAVGYEREHTEEDLQDLAYLDDLYEALLEVPWEKMPAVRRI